MDTYKSAILKKILQYGKDVKYNPEIDPALEPYQSSDWYLLLYKQIDENNWTLLYRFDSKDYETISDIELFIVQFIRQQAQREMAKIGKVEIWVSGVYKLLPKQNVPGRLRKKKLSKEDLIFSVDNGVIDSKLSLLQLVLQSQKLPEKEDTK